MKLRMIMKRMLQLLLAGLVTGGLLTAAWGQASYSTPYTFTTIAGAAGIYGFADGTNGTARFNEPVGIAVDVLGQLYVADYGFNTIRKITPAGTNWVVSTIDGT